MNSETPLSHNGPWTGWQKIAFRFFFVFLTLQVLTENFLGNLFGSTLLIWELGEKIFVQPCLWLNDHLFHFTYIPASWTSFSQALHTIRDIVYLFLAMAGCLAWTIFDAKRTNYRTLLYWFSQFLVVALSCISFLYGIIKVFPLQMQFPSIGTLHKAVGDLTPFELLWTTLGYGTPYQIFGGAFEVLAAVLIVFNRTRVAGLLIIVCVMLNVILLNYTYQVGVLITSFYILVIALFLLAPYAGQLMRFFFTKEAVALTQNQYVADKDFTGKWPKVMVFLIVGSSFGLSFYTSYNRYTRVESINQSRQYSLVKNYIVNDDTLRRIENDTLCWRIWSERVVNGKRFVTIVMKAGADRTYDILQDTEKHLLTLHPFNQADTTSLTFSYADIDKGNWRLEGSVKQKRIVVDLQRVKPDTTMNLLKTKPLVIIFNDEKGRE